LDTLGLVGAVEQMVRSYDQFNPDCSRSFQTFGDVSSLDDSLSIAAYRIVQEALSNVFKHSDASQVSVVVSVPPGAELLRLSIRDNGKGFDPATTSRGIGAIGMTERVFAFSGLIEFRTAPGKGTEVYVELPLKRPLPA
jgi:two-component system sensor histidine kinase UhpB